MSGGGVFCIVSQRHELVGNIVGKFNKCDKDTQTIVKGYTCISTVGL